MQEIGFWDYTCPQHGSLERYTRQDWDVLIDDMAAGGFNSLTLGIKWLTTGYYSQFDWLDQDPNCSAIASKNQLIIHALRRAPAWLSSHLVISGGCGFTERMPLICPKESRTGQTNFKSLRPGYAWFDGTDRFAFWRGGEIVRGRNRWDRGGAGVL